MPLPKLAGRSLGVVLLLAMPIQAATLDEEVTAVLEPFADPAGPGAAVMVISDGQIVLQRVCGRADMKHDRPITIETNFRLASVSKQFTATAIMLLSQRGRLSYDDPLTKFFPDFPEIGKQMTVRQLLWHTSGVVAYEDLIPDGQTTQLSDRDVLQLVERQHGVYFTPGTKFRYSNTGYALLALIVEQVSGQGFAHFLAEEIFQPIGMKATVAFEQGVSTVKNRAFGYDVVEGVFVDADQSVTSAVLGDGGIYTSLQDYFVWDQALMNQQLLPEQTWREAFEPGHLATRQEPIDYGFGWRIRDADGVRVLFHDGRTSGFNNAVRRVPARRLSVVVLTNRAGNHAGAMADAILVAAMKAFSTQ